MKCVGTTSIDKRDPLKEVNKNGTTIVNNKFTIKSKQSLKSEPLSDLPRLKKGFNGMGGQSKVLYIPKKTSGFKKPTSTVTSSVSTKGAATRKLKIPKNNTKISKFFEQK